MAIKEQIIKETLCEIIDPATGKDILSLDMVSRIAFKNGKVTVDLAVAKNNVSVTMLQRAIEQKLISVKGVDTVKVQLINLMDKKESESVNGLARVKRIIAVSSCKGGVGKSTVSALLATQFNRKGLKVGLIDADLYGPSIPVLFNIKKVNVTATPNNQLMPIESNGLKLMSFGFLLGDGPAVMRGPIVSRYIQEILTHTDWGELDYLFIDMPPGTGDIQLTITQTVKLDGAIIVTTPQTLSLVDVARGILMFEKVNVPVLGVIENMSYFMCDECDKKHFIFGKHSHGYYKDQLGTDILAHMPILHELTKGVKSFGANKAVDQLTDQVETALKSTSKAAVMTPDVSFDEQNIYLALNPQDSLSLVHKTVRFNCPCALCRDEMTGIRTVKDGEISEDIAPTEITRLGNYAIGIAWNDGHATGIYPYSLLQSLAKN